jgi:hypothetical protein
LSSKTLTVWGTLRNAGYSEQTPPQWLLEVKQLRLPTTETASGSSRIGERVPTPMANDARNNGGPGQQRRHMPQLNCVVGGKLSPLWTEWLMGFPVGWTDLSALATHKFQQWLHLHGKS